MYSSIIVLKGHLKIEKYTHFLLLIFAIRILASDKTCHLYNERAEMLLRKFVLDYGNLYGQHLISCNVHSLIHLPKFVRTHGKLDNFSCFHYENYLQLKKSSKYPLQGSI